MRSTAVFAVTLVAALFQMGGTAHAEPMPNTNSDFVDNVLLAKAESGLLIASSAVELQASDSQTISEKESKPTETPKPVEKPAPEKVYAVAQKGDSLSKIAQRYDTTWARIYDANTSIINPDVINPGDKLRIPAAAEKLARRAQPVVRVAASTSTQRKTTSNPTTSYPVSANAAKAYIYARESGNNPNATNPSGCYGIGQDCNGVLRTMCGADYACQDAYFTRYANARYGGWSGALAFWQSHHWW